MYVFWKAALNFALPFLKTVTRGGKQLNIFMPAYKVVQI